MQIFLVGKINLIEGGSLKTSSIQSEDRNSFGGFVIADTIINRYQIPKIYISVNTLRPRQNGRHFADDMFKCIFSNENVWIPVEISLKFVPKGSINNNPALVQIMAWRRPGDKPLSEPMMVSSLMHICVTRPQWVNLHTEILHSTTEQRIPVSQNMTSS